MNHSCVSPRMGCLEYVSTNPKNMNCLLTPVAVETAGHIV